MKQKLRLKYLLAVLLMGSAGLLTSVIFNQFSAADSMKSSVLLAQGKSKYDQYMQEGYAATRRRQYGRALNYFRLALGQRPGDSYALGAISNVERYQRRVERYGKVSGKGKPRRRTGAATRGGQCSDLIPLIPTYEEKCSSTQQATGEESLSLFLTTAKYPTFFFYIPQISPEEKLLFELKDNDNKNILYELTFKPPQKPGIISVVLPRDKLPLEANKEYRWSILVDTDRGDEDYPEGLIKREEPNPELTNKFEAASPLDRVVLYAENGYWEDSLRTIADLRRQRPQDEEINIEWGNLLGTVNLEEDVINAPLLPSQ
ncbi:DUF928 domain-containing protein [Plectonema cf. radiosum LEGE 06105]|uniref:DUF928 domain-containing protein n=1 Tax=Plectonema cf. radiosum LEGE 06105 TaxID=945769 RepID=A0A8J7FID3_9CYAN|nr:DUF928 domain-containing protein [Plectonema radiosum]MBE9214286.1 DUF928 domain-containing protein [Plectonema cf. radiosum LEGE 06105]